MKIYIKEFETDLRSSRCFIVTRKTQTELIGQLIQDTHFSLCRKKGEVIKFVLCWESQYYCLNFNYVVDPCNINQHFQFKEETLDISFNYKTVRNEEYLIYCPSIHLTFSGHEDSRI